METSIKLAMIAAVDRNLAIGNAGQLLAYIKEDLKRFRSLTLGQRVIYGRKTLMTFPKAAPLAQRENVMLTSNADFKAENLVVCHSKAELFTYLQACAEKEIMSTGSLAKQNYVIGGASLYHSLLPDTQTLELTEIDAAFLEADTYFPDFRADFELVAASPYVRDEETKLSYRYATYIRRQK